MLLFLATVSAQAQVTIGSKKIPSPFSILELISGSESNNGNRGLRLPQLTNAQRGKLQSTFSTKATTGAVGLRIFNINTLCVETWNGTNWIQSCHNNTPSIPVTVGNVGLCLTQNGLTYTYSATESPYLMPSLVEFFDGTTLVGMDTSAPFTHTFETEPTDDVTAVVTYPFFDAGDPPSDQIVTIGEAAYTMVGIPGGNFNMGFADEAAYNAAGMKDIWGGEWTEHFDDSYTFGEYFGSHSVNMSSFRIGETEVTQGLWKAVWGSDDFTPGPIGSDNHDLWTSSYGEDDAYPAYYVSWYDAIAFCNKLSKQEGKTLVYDIPNFTGDWSTFEYDAIPTYDNTDWDAVSIDLTANGYRLPTEAEWEYAARGGEDYRYSGSDEIDNVAWNSGNSSGSKEVKRLALNGYGLYDMSGNVWEWCNDYFTVYPFCGRVENSLPDAGIFGSFRVFRGGTWSLVAAFCAVSSRGRGTPNSRADSIGFRVVSLSL
jgi:formylglycine-generating enzyme required for sulfatase activity